jgi:hypothetical protein
MFHIQPSLDGTWISEKYMKCKRQGKMSKWIVGKPKVRWLELFQDYVPFAGFCISGAETSGSTTNGILKHNYNTQTSITLTTSMSFPGQFLLQCQRLYSFHPSQQNLTPESISIQIKLLVACLFNLKC